MRLFVGIFPPADAALHLDAALAAIRDVSGLRRWQPAERRHITLAFLGDVSPERAESLPSTLAAACTTEPAPRLRFAGSGSFRTGRGAGALWIGVHGGGLADLAARVRAGVAEAAEPRPFQAHLTVARWRPPERPDHTVLEELRSYRGPSWPVDEVALVRSHLGPRPRYERIAGWPLAVAGHGVDGGPGDG